MAFGVARVRHAGHDLDHHVVEHTRISGERRSTADLSRAQAVHQETAAYSMSGQVAPDAGAGGGQMGTTEATRQALRDKPSGKPVVRTEEKVGRNDPCPCGSGKKYKKCCGAGN